MLMDLYNNVPYWARNNDVNVYGDNRLKIYPKERVQSLYTVSAQQITYNYDTRFEFFDAVVIIVFDCETIHLSSVFNVERQKHCSVALCNT